MIACNPQLISTRLNFNVDIFTLKYRYFFLIQIPASHHAEFLNIYVQTYYIYRHC